MLPTQAFPSTPSCGPKLKKYAVLAGVNGPKKSFHGVREARAEVAAYADCTESQMMAMFGWTRPDGEALSF